MTNQLISIITVVFNDRSGLEMTAKSVASQTFRNLEWVVVDGASTDGTVHFLRENKIPPCVWISESDRGIYDAMNKGVRLARGRYAVFMNAGDVFDNEDVLLQVNNSLAEHKGEDVVVYGGAMLEFPRGRKIYRSPKLSEKYIWHGLPANHQATYYPVKWLMSNPYPDGYKMCGDYFMAARANIDGLKSVYLNFPLVRFRVGDTSYKHPFALIREAYLVQRKVLNSSLWMSCLSVVRRSAAIAATVIIYNLSGLLGKN